MSKEHFAIKVIWLDGEEEFVREGCAGGRVAVFASKRKATTQADFLREGMEDEVQSINVVQYPLATFRKP